MATEFDLRRSIAPPEGTELAPEEEARQKIVEHLKDVELESPRFQAFADYVDLKNSRYFLGVSEAFNTDLIKETIRQRINGVKGYYREYDLIDLLGHNYWEVLEFIPIKL